MLPLLFIFLAVAGIHSLPLQENCTETEVEFHDCLRKHYKDIDRSIHMEGYKSQRAAFIQCGAKHSGCYLQTTAMTMVDSLIQELKDGKVDDRGEITFDYSKAVTCFENLSKKFIVECLRAISFNEHGFRLTFSEIWAGIPKYIVAKRDVTNCSTESIDEWAKLESSTLNMNYRDQFSNFWLFVEMNAAMDDKKPFALPEKFVQPPHCKDSEEEFRGCVQEKKYLPSDYQTRRNVFVECGDEKSDCYLQQHLMKMINTINDTVVGFRDIEIGGTGCPDEIIFGMRPGFDEHGFPKSDREFDYHNDRCKTEQWKRTLGCKGFMVKDQNEITLMKYNIPIKEFAIYLGLIEEDVEPSQLFTCRSGKCPGEFRDVAM